MPTYEYACALCGHEMEIFQSINAERIVDCPSCSEAGLKRLIGRGGGIIFKGTGFYQTDYKNSAPPAAETGKETAGKAAAPASGESSPAKPATPVSPGSSSPTTSNVS